jgi:carbonic anhydrase
MLSRAVFLLGASVWFSGVSGALAQHHSPTADPAHPTAPSRTPDQILEELKEGNLRFRTDHASHPHTARSWLEKTAQEGQHPLAGILACSDSRVPPEILFDQGVGDLFVIRVAGNVANNDEIASIRYSLEHLGVSLMVVLGHTKCGAVTAVVEGGALPDDLEHLVHYIRGAAERAHQDFPGISGSELVEATVRLNVLEQMEHLLNDSEVVRKRVRSGKLKVVGAVYNIFSGEVEWLGTHPMEVDILRRAEGIAVSQAHGGK